MVATAVGEAGVELEPKKGELVAELAVELTRPGVDDGETARRRRIAATTPGTGFGEKYGSAWPCMAGPYSTISIVWPQPL